MKNMEKFKGALKSGKAAEVSYQGWRTALKITSKERKIMIESVEKAAKKGSAKVTKKIPILGLVFVAVDIRNKGWLSGSANSLCDQCPVLGWFKLGAECAGGEWFPDKPSCAGGQCDLKGINK